MPENNIAFRHGEMIEENSISQSFIEVSNSRGDDIEGSILLAEDNRTVIFKPLHPYYLGETIVVKLKDGLKVQSGKQIAPLQFTFSITQKIILPDRTYATESFQNFPPVKSKNEYNVKKSSSLKDNNLPEGFPDICIQIFNNPLHGYYFVSPHDSWNQFPEMDPFLIIFDLQGVPVYYRKMGHVGQDLKIQPAGQLSFFHGNPIRQHALMDSSFNIIDFYQIQNGYSYTDFHEFLLLENGNAFVITYDNQLVNMSLIVPGGDTNAVVTGFVFQELDTNKDVIFQWRSWDHFEITDAMDWIDLTEHKIDYVHGNAIEIIDDSSLIISCRNMDEITKINRNTGEIVWRLGGKNNQFDFLNDTLRFSMQHDCRILPNGNLTLFDNGTQRPGPKFSSAIEYEVDENAKTVTLKRRLRSTPDIFAHVMGKAQWHVDESVVVGWGSGNPDITEFTSNGDIAYELEMDGISYRAYRFPWKSNYFLLDTDTIQYGYIWHQSTLTKKLKVYNNSDKSFELTSYYSMNDAFTIENEFPVSLSQGQSVNLLVKFNPEDAGQYEGMLTINSDINSDTLVQRIAQQVYLIGLATEGQGYNDITENTFVNIYPNPVSDKVNIQMENDQTLSKVSIYNQAGQPLMNILFDSANSCFIDILDLIGGIYFLRIESNDYQIGIFKIIKI